MGLFDLLSGWTAWAPFTLIIVGLMGYAVGAITEKTSRLWLEHTCDRSCMRDQSRWLLHCRGYHLRKLDCTGYFHSRNLVQIGVAAVIVLLIVGQLQKIVNKML